MSHHRPTPWLGRALGMMAALAITASSVAEAAPTRRDWCGTLWSIEGTAPRSLAWINPSTGVTTTATGPTSEIPSLPSPPSSFDVAAIGIHARSGTIFAFDRSGASGQLYKYRFGVDSAWQAVAVSGFIGIASPDPTGLQSNNLNKMTVDGDTLFIADAPALKLYSVGLDASGNPTAATASVENYTIGSGATVPSGWVLGGGDITTDEFGDTYNITYDDNPATGSVIESASAYFYKQNAATRTWEYLGQSSAGGSAFAGAAFYKGDLYVKAARQLKRVDLTRSGSGYTGWNNPLINIGAASTLSSADLTACGTPNLSLTKSANVYTDAAGTTLSSNQSSARPGQYIRYTITAQNTGDTWARTSIINDTLPTGTAYVPNSAILNGTNLGLATYPSAGFNINSPSAPAGIVRYSPDPDTATLSFMVEVTANGGAIQNRATVVYVDGSGLPSEPPNCSSTPTVNCSDSPSLPVTPIANLTISKTGTSTATVGSSITYTIKAWNIGPDAISGATIADTVPSNLTSVTWSCAASGTASCGSTTSGSGNTISLTTGSLPANNTTTAPTSGSYLTLTVSGTASTAGSITNTASITAPSGVTDASGNNTSSQATTIASNPGSISGTLYRDTNTNNTFDSASDTRLGTGITVELVDSGGTVIATATTDTSGNYSFTGVAPGTYTVRVVSTDPDLPARLSPTAPATGSSSVSVTAGTNTAQNFGYQTRSLDVVKSAGSPVQVSATAFEVPYTVVVGNTGQLSAPNVQVSENLSLTYPTASSITLVGTPAVTATGSSGATCTANASFNGTSVFGLLSGTNDLASGQNCTIAFRVRVTYASAAAIPTAALSNQVYASSLPDSVATTNPGYTFPGGTPTAPTGAVATDTSTNATNPAAPGSLPSTPGSDIPSGTPVTLTPNPGSISGTLYRDTNTNNTFDSASDTRLGAGISVELVDSGGVVVATTTTDASGNYSFSGVAPGTYTVRAVNTDPDLPARLAPTAPATGSSSVTVAAGSTNTQNFGYQTRSLDVIKSVGAPVQISATVYEVPFTVVVGNTGQLSAPNVQVSENLSRSFASGSPTISLVGSPAVTATGSSGASCTANASFNGTSVFGLLSGTDDLAAGQSCTIAFRVRLSYASASAIPTTAQSNQVYASSLPDSVATTNPGHTFPGGVPTAPTGAVASDTSTNTTNPASPSGLPSTPGADTGSPTPITFTPNPGSISGTLYIDQNNNSSFDSASDPRIGAGVSVELVDGSGTVIATATTDSSGNYRFNNVNPGSYTVRVVTADPDLDGATASAPASGSLSVNVNPGLATANQNFGFSQTALDVIKSASAPRQMDVRTFEVTYTIVAGNTGTTALSNVQLSENLNLTFSSGSPTLSVSGLRQTAGTAPCTVNTAFNGTSDFRLLVGTDSWPQGSNCTLSFTVRVVYPDVASVPSSTQNNSVYGSSTPTGPNPGHSFPGGVPTAPIGSVATDTSSTTSNPASPSALPTTPGADTPGGTPVTFAQNLGSISGTLYNDLNGNRSFDGTAADSRLGAGITVELVDASGAVVATTTTDGQGNYSFNAVQPGTYSIRVPTNATNSNNPTLGTLQPVTPSSLGSVVIAAGTITNNRNFGFNNPPIADNDAATTPYNTPVTFSAVSGDSDPDGFVDASSIDLDPATAGEQKTLATADGTFSVDGSGNVTFTPNATFSGTASIPYTLKDNTGNTSNQATLSVTVQPPLAPVAVADSSSTRPDETLTLDPKLNDSTPNRGASIVPSSVVFPSSGQPAGTVLGSDGKSLYVPNQGLYTISPSTGEITFDPCPVVGRPEICPAVPGGIFLGDTSPVVYTFQDSTGQTSNPATVSINVRSPAARDDSATTPFGTPVTLNAPANDLVAAGRTLVPSSVVFTTTGQPSGAVVSPDGKTLTVPGEGTYQVQPDGQVVFTPSNTFSGNTKAVQYTITDSTGAVSNPANLRVVVGPPAVPVASPDTATTPFGTPVSLSPASNDTAGTATNVVSTRIDLDPATPGQETVRNVPGQGLFELLPDGTVRFTPEPGFAGTVQIPYTIQDNLGQTSAASTLTVNVTPPPAPVARDDQKAGDYNQPVSVAPLLNDSSSPNTSIVPGSIDLDPSTPGQETTRTIAGKGTFTVQPDGTVVFTPVSGFEGTVVVPYTLKDNLGQTSNPANIAVTIRPKPAPPVATDDYASTPRGIPVSLNASSNDSASLPNTLALTTIDLDPATPGQQTSYTVDGRGTYTVGTGENAGKVIFTPAPGFVGTVSIPYTIQDNLEQPSNPANLTVTVSELPAARDDSVSTPRNTPVSLNPASNDVADTGKTINPSTIDLDPATPGQQTSYEVPGQGQFELQADGSVRFSPAPGFVGVATTPYTVQDNDGTITSPANLIVTVLPAAPSASDDTATTPFNTPITLNPNTNDTPGTGGQLRPSTIDLDPATPGQQTSYTVPGQGTFVLQPATNLTNESVQFVPVTGFSGTVSIPYTIADNFGQTSNPANLTVTVNPPSAPIASNDFGSTKINTPVTLNPAANDTPGSGTRLVPGSIDLDPATPGQQTSYTAPGQGTFVLNPDGSVAFTPVDGFVGTAQAPYTISDQQGQPSNTARIVVTVSPLPAASNDSVSTPFNTPVTLQPLVNDTPNQNAVLNPNTLDLDPLTPGIQTSLTVPGKGTFSHDGNGNVTFTPADGFTGTVTVPYTVQDSTNGTTNTATISVTVIPPAAPVASDDAASTPFNTPVTLNPASNDRAGSGGALVPGSIDLDPATPGQQTSLNVPGKGTFVLNPDGSVSFTPANGFVGEVKVPYTIRDNAGQASNPANLTVTIESPRLSLTKQAVQSTARVGGTLEYILRVTNQGSGVPMRQITLEDILPLGLQYRAGSSRLGNAATGDPQIYNSNGRQRLVWVVDSLAAGQSAEIRFATTVTAAAGNAPLVNQATASALVGSALSPTRIISNVATATVRIEAGVFSDNGTILGRVYFDKNNDNNFTQGVDEPLQGVRVYLSDGRYAVTDRMGRYSLSEVTPGLHSLRVDRLSVPYMPKAVPDDRGLRGTREVRVQGGGIYTEDFLFEAPAAQAQVTRSTRVSVNGQKLEKTLTQVSANTYTVTLTLTLTQAVANLRIVDPLPAGSSRSNPSSGNLSGNEITLGNLAAGTYTLTYTLTGSTPIDRLVTDPDLFFEEVR